MAPTEKRTNRIIHRELTYNNKTQLSGDESLISDSSSGKHNKIVSNRKDRWSDYFAFLVSHYGQLEVWHCEPEVVTQHIRATLYWRTNGPPEEDGSPYSLHICWDGHLEIRAVDGNPCFRIYPRTSERGMIFANIGTWIYINVIISRTHYEGPFVLRIDQDGNAILFGAEDKVLWELKRDDTAGVFSPNYEY